MYLSLAVRHWALDQSNTNMLILLSCSIINNIQVKTSEEFLGSCKTSEGFLNERTYMFS